MRLRTLYLDVSGKTSRCRNMHERQLNPSSIWAAIYL